MSNRTCRINISPIAAVASVLVFVALAITIAYAADRSFWDQSKCRSMPAPGFDSPSMASYHAEYVNSLYEYSVLIPDGLVGYSSPPPAPAHGFGVLLGSKGEGYLWVDGSWNSLDYQSAQDAGQRVAAYLQKRGAIVSSAKERSWMLAGIRATRVTLEYSCPDSRELFVNETVVALSPNKSRVWKICLDTKQSRYEAHIKIFEAVLKSWRYRPGGK